ncbi:MAG: hypothetical protein HDT28_00585 [Clostridiales bacterium]|nr:hypothetical protein [Clostridiales bacterium]
MLKALRKNSIEHSAALAELRRVPQYAVPVYELLSYALVPLFLIMAGAMPSSALMLMPIILPMLYLLYRRFGLYLPLGCVIAYGACALTLNYDILTVIYSVALFFGLCGLTLSAQFPHYLACAAIAAISAVSGALVGVGIVRLVAGVPIAEIATNYASAEYADPIIGWLARSYYNGLDLPIDIPKLMPTDAGYTDAVKQFFGEYAGEEFGPYIWYYCLHFGGVTGGVGFVLSVIINRRTASFNDFGTTEAELKLSTRALGGVRVMTTPLSQMSMPRSYLWSCVLPAALAGIVLEFVGGFEALAATFMHAFATLPSALTCFALLVYFSSLFKGKAKIAATVVVAVIGVVMVIFPMALFILSMIGLCDCILNLRWWTEFIMKD